MGCKRHTVVQIMRKPRWAEVETGTLAASLNFPADQRSRPGEPSLVWTVCTAISSVYAETGAWSAGWCPQAP